MICRLPGSVVISHAVTFKMQTFWQEHGILYVLRGRDDVCVLLKPSFNWICLTWAKIGHYSAHI